MKGIEVRKMRFKEKEIVLKDGTKCILRSPNEDDEKEMKEAENMGYEQIELALFSNNEKAKHIYEKHGFEVWGIMKRAFKLKDGTYYHEINMRKFLK